MSQFEVRANIKFLTKLQWKPTEIIEALQNVYGDSSPSRAVVYRWIRRFKDGRGDLEDDPRGGRPSTSKNAQNIELVRNLIEEDRRITVNQIANELGISFGSTFSILTEDLGFSKLSARWVPKALQQNQCSSTHGQDCNDNFTRVSLGNPFTPSLQSRFSSL